jgi:hypothetical protein
VARQAKHDLEWKMAEARAQLELARAVDQPWCADAASAADGAFAGPAKTSQGGQYMAADGVYRPSACRLLVVRQELLLRAFGGKRILLLGDTHVRNVFLALVAAVRRQVRSFPSCLVTAWSIPPRSTVSP